MGLNAGRWGSVQWGKIVSKAHLNFNDRGDGTFEFAAWFEGGFDPKSTAHQHANLCLKYLDSIAERLEAPKIEMVPGEELEIIVP